MKGIKYFIVFLVLSASLMCTSEAARSRTSNQNSFRRAANGIYQTLSSVFGEDNIKGLYKVRHELVFPDVIILARRNQHVRRSSWLMAERKLARSGPTINLTDAILGISGFSQLQMIYRRGSFNTVVPFLRHNLGVVAKRRSFVVSMSSIGARLVQPVWRPEKIRFLRKTTNYCSFLDT